MVWWSSTKMNKLNEPKTCCVFVLNQWNRTDEFQAIPYEAHGVSLGIVKAVLDFSLEDFKVRKQDALRLRIATALLAFNIHLIGYDDKYAEFEMKPVNMKDISSEVTK